MTSRLSRRAGTDMSCAVREGTRTVQTDTDGKYGMRGTRMIMGQREGRADQQGRIDGSLVAEMRTEGTFCWNGDGARAETERGRNEAQRGERRQFGSESGCGRGRRGETEEEEEDERKAMPGRPRWFGGLEGAEEGMRREGAESFVDKVWAGEKRRAWARSRERRRWEDGPKASKNDC
ncbi:hypothetical protein OH77DRAFT_754862 [Trametes cingulata]|nr:hypothetical protein OH77DRAFT_754862 [Trametes cingulata]